MEEAFGQEKFAKCFLSHFLRARFRAPPRCGWARCWLWRCAFEQAVALAEELVDSLVEFVVGIYTLAGAVDPDLAASGEVEAKPQAFFAGVAADDFSQLPQTLFAVLAFVDADYHTAAKLLRHFLQRHELINDQVDFFRARPAVDFTDDAEDRFGLNEMAILGELLRPENTANDAVEIFQVPHGEFGWPAV